jgi:Amt family ammonium transporter
VVGFCVGAVVGLVAITPAAGFVAIPQSIFIGFIAAVISNIAVQIRSNQGWMTHWMYFPAMGSVVWLVC